MQKLWTVNCKLWTKRGFTLIELLVVLVILGFFVAMMAKSGYAEESNVFIYGEDIISDDTSSSVYVYGSEEEESREQAKFETLEKAQARKKMQEHRYTRHPGGQAYPEGEQVPYGAGGAGKSTSQLEKEPYEAGSVVYREEKKICPDVLEKVSAGDEVKFSNRWVDLGNETSASEKDFFIKIGVQSGYLSGDTTYNFDHGTSELEFPMDNWMVGGNLSMGSRDLNLSLNAEAWTNLEDDAGDERDSDYTTTGVEYIRSYSRADMDALVCDVNLRYDFYHKSTGDRKDKVGVLLGYKYERFDYDMYGLRYAIDLFDGYPEESHMGEKIGTYQIKYHMPYIGVASEYSKDRWGLELDLKFSPYVTAEDYDGHLLRGLDFYADYKGIAWMIDLSAFWRLTENWRINAGVDFVFIDTEGNTWEKSGDPAWDKDQESNSRQYLGWCGVSYEF